MVTHNRFLAFGTLLVLFYFSTTYAQMRVEINVTWDERSGNGAIVKSTLARELRALGDILVVESDPSYRVKIVGLDTHNVSGRPTGYAMSYVATSCFPTNLLTLCVPDTSWRSLMAGMLYDFGKIIQFQVLTGSESDLQLVCTQLVAELDVDVFQPSRGAERRLLEALEKARSTPTNTGRNSR